MACIGITCYQRKKAREATPDSGESACGGNPSSHKGPLGVRLATSLSPKGLMDWKKILKVMLGTGLFLMETNRVGNRVRGRVKDLSETARDKYSDLMDRVDDISDSLSGRRDYVTPIGSFLVGMGIGAGLGLLFAPASGEETRSAIWDQASQIKNRVADRAADLRDRASDRASEFADQARETVRRETSSSSSTPYSRPA